MTGVEDTEDTRGNWQGLHSPCTPILGSRKEPAYHSESRSKSCAPSSPEMCQPPLSALLRPCSTVSTPPPVTFGPQTLLTRYCLFWFAKQQRISKRLGKLAEVTPPAGELGLRSMSQVYKAAWMSETERGRGPSRIAGSSLGVQPF